ncbi:prepilin-type N-terminal cleavage/methylation domain-containing protein [Photobacterium leiognathi]|uniref:prepilin-type N-terminal cleavage/methylation domain-containing protein n=1 Tax=Photobacterium leiognathi TaxID=553611 RepID=UPI002981DD52|nr:prepilin-type N-terminal cleavage/methylation domain-containing protein [Photobacterium leiognathi]
MNKLNKTNNEKGFTLIELLVVLVVISVLTLVGMAVKPKVLGYMSNIEISSAVDSIASVAPSYLAIGLKPTDLSMAIVCQDGALSKRVCGVSNNGVGANPFGGDYKIGASKEYPGHITITVTGIKSGAENVIVSSLLSRSIEQCTSVDGCMSAQITKTSGRHGGTTTSVEIDI